MSMLADIFILRMPSGVKNMLLFFEIHLFVTACCDFAEAFLICYRTLKKNNNNKR